MNELPTALASSDLAPAGVHTEIFGTGPALNPGLTTVPARPVHPPAGPPGTGPRISFARSGLTVGWDPAYASLLELADAHPLVMPYGRLPQLRERPAVRKRRLLT